MKYIVTHTCCYPSNFAVRIFEDYEAALECFKVTRQELLEIWDSIDIDEDSLADETMRQRDKFPVFAFDGGEYDRVELNMITPIKAGGGRFQYVA